jgi:hypothetical protein
MPRYAILYHQLPAGGQRPSHWDLLLESGETLRTWALIRPPEADKAIAADRLADHRVEYLEYEGPVSGNRGVVSRWDAGTFRWLADGPELVAVALDGRQLKGQLTLVPAEASGERWECRYHSRLP